MMHCLMAVHYTLVEEEGLCPEKLLYAYCTCIKYRKPKSINQTDLLVPTSSNLEELLPH